MNARKLIRRLSVGLLLVTAGAASTGCNIVPDYEFSSWGSSGGPTGPSGPQRPSIWAPERVRAVEGYTDTINVSAYAQERIGADLTHLPEGNDACFVAAGDASSGRFTWTPKAGERGKYPVVFSATNSAGTTTVTSSIYVTDHLVDHPPTVIAPAETTITVGQELRLHVDAEDPDGDPIFAWAATCDHWWYPYVPWTLKYDRPEDGATLVYTSDWADTLAFTFYAHSFETGSAATRILIQELPAAASR